MVWLATKKIDSLRILSQSQNSKVTVIIIYQLKPLSIFSTRDEKWNLARGQNNTNRLLWDQQLKGIKSKLKKRKKSSWKLIFAKLQKVQKCGNCKLSIALNDINFVAAKKYKVLSFGVTTKERSKKSLIENMAPPRQYNVVGKTLPSHCLLSDRMSAVKVEPWLKIHFTKSQNPHPWISSSVSSLKAKGLRFSRGFSSVQRNPLTERFISSTIHSCISIGNCCYIHICIFPPNQ